IRAGIGWKMGEGRWEIGVRRRKMEGTRLKLFRGISGRFGGRGCCAETRSQKAEGRRRRTGLWDRRTTRQQGQWSVVSGQKSKARSQIPDPRFQAPSSRHQWLPALTTASSRLGGG